MLGVACTVGENWAALMLPGSILACIRKQSTPSISLASMPRIPASGWSMIGWDQDANR